MSTSVEYTPAELHDIARTIKAQIGIWPFAEIGARDFRYGNFKLQGMDARPGLMFTAKPLTRLVDVFVLLEPNDTYRVIVNKRNVHVPTRLMDLEGVYADVLPRVIIGLTARANNGWKA